MEVKFPLRNVFQIPEENFLLILVATEASTDFERSKKPKGKSDIEKICKSTTTTTTTTAAAVKKRPKYHYQTYKNH